MRDEVRALEPRRSREGQLAGRGDVGADALLGEEPQELHVREGLGAVDDERVRHRLSDFACSGAQRVLAVDHEGRSEAYRELARPEASDVKLALHDSCGIREELEHPPILPVTLFSAWCSFLPRQGAGAARAVGVPLEPLAREAFLFPQSNTGAS